jgi:hypothetical protein
MTRAVFGVGLAPKRHQANTSVRLRERDRTRTFVLREEGRSCFSGVTWAAAIRLRLVTKPAAASVPLLPTANLHKRHHCIDTSHGSHLRSVAAVFMSQYSGSPRIWAVELEGDSTRSYEVRWRPPTVVHRRACANLNEAVEEAGYCMSLAAVDARFSRVALRRVHTGLHFDFVVIPSGAEPGDDLGLDWERDDISLVEVSGINRDTPSEIRRRLKEKEDRALESPHPLPYERHICVVGFQNARIVFRKVE